MNCKFTRLLNEKHLQYRNSHCAGTFQFVIKSVEEAKDNLHFLYICLHLYRSKLHNIHMKRDHPCCIFYVHVQSIQSRISE